MTTPTHRARRSVLLALAPGLLACACTGAPIGHPGALASSASRRPGPTPSPSHIRQYLPHATPSIVPAPGATTRGAPPAAPVLPVAAGPGSCLASDLHLSIGRASDAAGSTYYPLDLTNVGSAACTLYGYPGVSFVTEPNGAVIGGTAVRDPAFPKVPVTLDPGATAHASLQVAVARNYPESVCKPVLAHWLAVYPPGSYAPLYLAFTAATCTGHIPSGSTLGIYVVRPGATGP